MADHAIRVVPSGRQVTLTRGTATATVVEVGGGLRTFDVDGHPVLDGYDEQEMCTAGRGQVLVPWPNRIADGRYTFDGAEFQLPIPEPAGNAIHGLTRWANWTFDVPDAARAVATHRLYPQPGYPFALDVSTTYQLAADGLEVRMSVTNVGAAPAPVGMGCHPYITVGTATVDAAALRVPADTRIVTDPRGIPTGRQAVADSPFDFRTTRPVGSLRIDTPYTDLHRDPDGRARVVLASPDGPSVTVWMDETWPFLQVFTGDTVPQESRRRGGLAVEPMTCAPDAFRSGDGLRILAPGDTLAGTWGITVTS